jgi:hypothetical protein
MAESYWDSLKKAIGNAVGNALATPIKAVTGLGAGVTQARVAVQEPELAKKTGVAVKKKIEKKVDKAATDIATTAVDIAARPMETIGVATAVDDVLQAATDFYQWAYPKITRPISTAVLANADAVAGNGYDLIKAWDLAKDVSPFQAYAAVIGANLERTGVTPALEEQGIDLPRFLETSFNIADPDDRKVAFEKEIVGKVFTGFGDGLLNWYTDPGVLVGKALKFGKILGLDRPITSAEDVVRLRSELDSHGLWLKSGGAIGRETPMGVIAQRLTEGDSIKNYDDVFVRRTTNRTFLADVTGEAQTYDEVADIIAAAAGDKNSYNRLLKTRASIADEIDRARNILDPVEKRYNDIPWGQGVRIEDHLPTVEEYDRLTAVLDDLIRRDENLAKAINENIGDYRIINDYTSAADVQLFNKNIGVAIEKAKAKASEAYHNASFYTETFQKNPFTRPVTVVTLPFSKLPRGIVRVDGGPVADSFSEIKYALNSVKPLRNAEYLEVKSDLARSYLNARNAKERLAAVENIEAEIADIIALEKGFTVEEAREIYQQFGNVRRGVMSGIQQNGFYVDEMGKLVTSPFWRSEMPNIVPMMDFKDFEKVLDAYRVFKEPGVRGVAMKSEVTDWIDFANSLFKVSVLTRLGYPIRNTIDGQLRAGLVLNSLAKTDDAFKNFRNNTAVRFTKTQNYFEDTLKIQNPKQLNEFTGRLVFQRNQMLQVRESILDEVTPQAYYAGASGKFGKQVDPTDVEIAMTSKTKPLLKDSERNAYFELMAKRKKQNGLLFGDDQNKLKNLQSKAFGRYVREEVVPTLPKGTTLVYADYPSGKVFYKIPGTKGRLPKGAIPDQQARKGLPSAVLYDELVSNGKIKVRGKGPIQQPDIRVITDYDLARKGNFEEIADIIPEDQMYRIRFFQQQIDALDNQILEKIEQSTQLNTIRSELKIVRSGDKPIEFTTRSGTKVQANGAFSGPNGDLTRRDVSSMGSLNWMTENQAYMSFDAQKGASAMNMGNRLSEARTVVQPTDPQYYNEMSVFANFILRNDPLAMRILQGESDKAIASWLRSDGKFYIRDIDGDIEPGKVLEHIAEARARINRIFPDQQVRNLIAREELTPMQFDALMRGNPNLAPIAGRDLVENTLGYGKGAVKRSINGAIENLFKVIGSTPEDNLVAWPFYQKLYLRNLKREADIAEGLGKNLQDPQLIIQLERAAHAASRKTTMETLYRITNNTGLSNTLRFVIPFFNAQYNAIKVYGKLLLQDPSRIARAAQIWNLPNRVAVVVDQDGDVVPPGVGPSTQQYILFNIPEGVEGRFGIPKGFDISIPKNSLNVFLQGENPLFPAFGIPVTIPVSAFANERPEAIQSAQDFLTKVAGETVARSIMSSIMPFGRPAQDPWKLLLPAAAQKAVALQNGLDDGAFANSVRTAMKVLDYQWRSEGMIGKRPTFKDALELGRQTFEIRLAANMVLPFTFSFRPEYQFIVDDWRRAINDPKIGPGKIDEYIMTMYGEKGFFVTAPSARNRTGVFQTADAVRNAKEFAGLIGKMDENKTPGLAGFIANFGTTADKYSDAAANFFRDKTLRPGGETKWTESRVTKDILKDREISLGWSAYQKGVEERDAELASYGINSINSSAAADLGIKERWDTFVENLGKKYEAWGYEKEMGDFDLNRTKRYVKGVIDLVSNEKFMKKYGSTKTMQAMTDYVLNRTYVSQELATRKEYYGSGSIDAEDNADLKEQWDEYIMKMKMYDKGFADFYTRYLENDKFGVIKNG